MEKLGLKLVFLENHFISYSCIILIFFSMLWGEVASNSVVFQKFIFLQFRSIESVFRSIKIAFKNFCEPLSGSINRTCFSINRTSSIKFFFKNSDLTCSSTFSNFPLSLQLSKAPLRIFCRFQPNFLQSFSLPRPVRPLYPSFCFYFHDFMHKLMHFNGIFRTFHVWDFCWIIFFFLKLIIGFCSYIVRFMDICWLIWSIWGFVKNWKF